MRDLLPGLLERADLALASCEGVLETGTLAPLTSSVRAVRARLSYPDDVAVVAIAGGTGSGKSSLLNALTGEELSDVGGMRPTTAAPLAAVPSEKAGAMAGYLDMIEIEARVAFPGNDLCLIDLPDTDSVVADHRHQVDALLGVVDLVIWVVDPEKYRDARLHHDYLRPMAAYSGQFIFALNQVDRLDSGELTDVLADMSSALTEDGIADAVVVAVAAGPPTGPPMGLEELRSAVVERLGSGRAVYDKLLVDLDATARSLAAAVSGGLDFDRRARQTVDEAVGELIVGDEAAPGRRLMDLLDEVSAEAGGLIGGRIRAHAADIPGHLARIMSQVRPVEHRSLLGRLRKAPEAGAQAEVARELIEESVIRPVRALLARRALAAASVSELSLEVSRVRAETGRR
jgi:hypothetical protein